MPTDQMVEAAIAFCASKAFAGDTAHARQALRQGRCDVCDYLRYSLAKQIGDYLGQMDPTVRAVYVFEAEPAEIEGSLPCRRTGASGISLIAWVDRKTAALSALVAALEADLARGRHRIGCASATPGCYFLDVHMVDDADVRERRGYGALVNGLYVRPVEVWTRAD
jgi:hypothetical protein